MYKPAKLVKSFGYRASAVAGLWAAVACGGGDGRVDLQFDLPEKEELSPIAGDRLTDITLIAWDQDGNQSSATYPVGDPGPIELGRLPVGAEVTLGVELRAASSRLIGFGRSQGAVAVDADEPVVVPISVRRPFVYVPGGGIDLFGTITPTLATFDSTLDPGNEELADYKGTIGAGMTATASAATSDGRELIVVGESGPAGLLRLMSTSSHEPTQVDAAAIAARPVDVAVTPDGSYAIVAHDGPDGGVSVVDLGQLRGGAGDGAAVFAPLGSVGAVAVSGDRATGLGYALIDRAPRRVDLSNLDVNALRAFRTDRLGCAPAASSLVIVPLSDPGTPRVEHALGGPVQDIAVSADGATIALADACNDAVRTVNPDSGAVADLAALADATTVAIHGGRVHAAGTLVVGGAATIQILSLDFDGEIAGRVTLPTRQERSVLLDLSLPGQSTEIAVAADTAIAYELAVAPDSAHVALLVEAYHHADAVTNLPEIEIDTYEYLLVNLSSGAQIHRVRNYCLVSQLSGSEFELECASTPEQDAIPNEGMYIPLSLSVLYGDR